MPKKKVTKQTAGASSQKAKAAIPQPPVPLSGKPGSFRIRKTYLITILAFIILGILVYTFRDLFVAAVVNGQPISRVSVVRETEKQSGEQTLNTLIRNTLIEQEASRQRVTVSAKEIDDEIKKVEDSITKQGQNLDQLLKAQRMTRDDLRKLIRLDKLVEKMVKKDVKVSDKDITAYIKQNKDALPKDQSESELKKSVKERLQQQQLSEKVQSWLQNLQKKAKIIKFVQY